MKMPSPPPQEEKQHWWIAERRLTGLRETDLAETDVVAPMKIWNKERGMWVIQDRTPRCPHCPILETAENLMTKLTEELMMTINT